MKDKRSIFFLVLVLIITFAITFTSASPAYSYYGLYGLGLYGGLGLMGGLYSLGLYGGLGGLGNLTATQIVQALFSPTTTTPLTTAATPTVTTPATPVATAAALGLVPLF
ncbi:MAG: hypothetical protein ACMUIU_20080 [bacterium]